METLEWPRVVQATCWQVFWLVSVHKASPPSMPHEPRFTCMAVQAILPPGGPLRPALLPPVLSSVCQAHFVILASGDRLQEDDVLKTLLIEAEYEIVGTVQGVGFRPAIYRLARAADLGGFVQNRSGTVKLVLQGESASIDSWTWWA